MQDKEIKYIGNIIFQINNISYFYIMKQNSFEPLPPLPEWQERIDKVIEMRNEYIKSNFPEFYVD